MQTRTYIALGEDGIHTVLSKDSAPSEDLMIGAERQMATQGRRGFVTVIEGDPRAGNIRKVRDLNGPQGAFETAAQLLLKRLGQGRSGSNVMFRSGVGG